MLSSIIVYAVYSESNGRTTSRTYKSGNELVNLLLSELGESILQQGLAMLGHMSRMPPSTNSSTNQVCWRCWSYLSEHSFRLAEATWSTLTVLAGYHTSRSVLAKMNILFPFPLTATERPLT